MALIEELTPRPPPLRTAEGGVVRVGKSRGSLDTVLGAFNQGCSPEEIVLRFPTLQLADVYAVITYYFWHREEVEAYLERRRQEAEELHQQMEERFPPQGIRER